MIYDIGLELGGVERTLSRVGSPCSTLVSHSCFNSFSNLLGRPGYMLEPPESTIALYREVLTSTSAA